MIRNSLLKSSIEYDENKKKINKKINLPIEIIEKTKINQGKFIENLNYLIEQSLKQTDEYRFKFQKEFFKDLSKKSSNQLIQIKTKDLIKSLSKLNIQNDKISLNSIEDINENNICDYNEYYSKYLNNLLNIYLNNNQIYEYFNSKLNILSLSEQIKDFFKKFSNRYKIIVHIIYQQYFHQSILIVSKSLWNKQYDQFFQFYFFKNNIQIIIIVFFIYKE